MKRPSVSQETSNTQNTINWQGGCAGRAAMSIFYCFTLCPHMKLHRGAGTGVHLLHRDCCNLISLTKPQSGADLAVPLGGVEISVPAEVPANTGRKVQWLLSGLLINVKPGSPYHQELPLGYLLSSLHMSVSWDKFSVCANNMRYQAIWYLSKWQLRGRTLWHPTTGLSKPGILHQ